MTIHAKTALLGSDWVHDLRVKVSGGRIAGLETGAVPAAGDVRIDTLLPALGNLHSHAFQRAMAGMTETRAAGKESFWTWRSLMYRFLDRLTPEQVEAIAALVYMEMQEAGYASVGEFHYVHHQPGGTPYGRLSELSQRIFAAARQTGIGLTHLPVLYTYGGVRQEPLSGGQLRFGNDVDQFLNLVSECRGALPEAHPDTRVGTAPHSLRATSPADLAAVLAQMPEGPVHIHISEQLQEVADVEARFGQRPVSWLLDNVAVDARWCLIHATHMTDDETARMARSGAVAGLCPITESNLGDGIFNGAVYVENGGAFGVGSDSNVRISLTEELRTLEYSQRLRDMARTVLVPGEGSVGHALYTGAARGGAQALGRDAGEIAVGRLADLVAIDREHPSLCALADHQLLDGLCFAAPDAVVTDLWSTGRHMVQGGRHVARDAIVAGYRNALAELLAAA
ncbi:formimidoylglutamate deiminase [Ruegeria sediminis]|uniref:Formimidoylglutamate deiminase n=1 Tax=Ruegeria sediminis TaxID=2583820 RepID=A0ABY2WUR5_9RHOB|nr:formimidoylglutamate deiminase [Ruegeria sediminis]TMV04961.1 formimidoylglutamate deiminase [Ruegeria sediminis]